MLSARLNRNPASSQAGGGQTFPVMAPSNVKVRVPEIDKDLIAYLQAIFPVSLSPEYSLRDYDRMLGAQQVIEHLKSLWEAQNNSRG